LRDGVLVGEWEFQARTSMASQRVIAITAALDAQYAAVEIQ